MIPFQFWCLIISPPVSLQVFGGSVTNSLFQWNSDLSLTRKSQYFFNFRLDSFDFPLISFCKVKAYLEASNMISVFMSQCEQSACLLSVLGEVRHCWATQEIFVRRWVGVRWGRIHQATALIQQIMHLLHQHLHMYVCVCACTRACVSDSLQPHRLQPIRLPCPWSFSGKNAEMFCHFLFQSSKPRLEPESLCLLFWQADSLPLVPPGKPTVYKRHDLWGKGWSEG